MQTHLPAIANHTDSAQDTSSHESQPLSPERWNRALLAATQTTRKLVYRGAVRDIDSVSFQLDGSSVLGTAYLSGETGGTQNEHIEFLPVSLDLAAQHVDARALQVKVVLHALQTAYPLRHRGLNVFVHTLHIAVRGGELLVKVYLMGRPESVAPEDLERHDRPLAVLQEQSESAH